MEWGRIRDGGGGGIKVNALSPGHIVTPMALRNFEEVEGLRECWERKSMLGRLASPEEFQSTGLFLLSRASSFMVSWFPFFLPFWRFGGSLTGVDWREPSY